MSGHILRSSLLVAALVAAGQQITWAQNTPPGSVPGPARIVIQPAVAHKAQPLPLADVRLTGGPLKAAQDLAAGYLLTLDLDRMMVGFYLRAGMEPKAAQGYGGWDDPNSRQLNGHIAGHYLSGVSYMYAATGNPEFKRRADYLVSEMAATQAKQGDGYLGALLGRSAAGRGADGGAAGGGGRGGGTVDGKELFRQLSEGQIRSGGFDLNGMWSPWYVQHKIFAGLRDAYRLTGNKQALEVETKFAGWVDTILKPLNPEQIQRMLNTEFGAMNEVLVDLYADTGDRRWYDLSEKFTHRALVDPLARGEDILTGKHGNTQVPKLLGDLQRWVYGGDEISGRAGKFFWDRVAHHHSFATGGHGRNESFGRPDVFTPMLEGRTCETCNVYNMVKYSREMFAIEPDIKVANFHERALFNHILASINPRNSAFAYMVPVGQAVRQEYNSNDSFTCCVGTGMESHGLHGYGVYYESGDRLWVNLFAPSSAVWKAQNVRIDTETSFPDGEGATIKVTPESPRNLTISIRRPYWAGEGFSVTVNGQAVAGVGQPDSYVDITRSWTAGDTIAVTLPKRLWKATLPDNANKAALMWGPLVLAADMTGIAGQGRGARGGAGGAAGGARGRGAGETQIYPIFVSDEPIEKWLVPVEGARPGTFRATGRAPSGTGTTDVTFNPFYRTHNITYGIYWDVMTTAEWNRRAEQLASEQERQQRLNAATVAYALPGMMQMERDFNYQAGEESQPVTVADRTGRRAATWMSFDLPVEPARPMVLVVTYRNDEPAARRFAVQVDGQSLREEVVERVAAQEFGFVDREYAIPAALVQGKQKVTVRFQAAQGSEVARVFGIRMLRGDAQ